MKVKMYELSKKTISTLIMTILMLSMALALPAAAVTDGIKIAPTPTPKHSLTGTADWTTAQAKSGGYSVILYTAGGVNSYGAVDIPIGPIPLQSLTTDPSYWVYETTLVPHRHPYVNIVLDLNTDDDPTTVEIDYLEGVESQTTAGAQPPVAAWTEMKEAAGYYNTGNSMGSGYTAFDDSGTLSQWKTFMDTKYPDAKVIRVQLCFGMWEDSTIGSVYVDNMKIGGVTYPLEPKEGPVGTLTTIAGYGATPGGLVKVYWGSVKDWDGTGGLLAEAYAKSVFPYAYSIDITIPEAVAGAHGIVVKDMESITSITTPFTVTPKIVLTPKAGLRGDVITVKGTGFVDDTLVTAKYLKTGSVLTDLTLSPSGLETSDLGSFTATFVIPEDAIAINYITAKADVSAPAVKLTVGTCITLTPSKGIAGTTVTVSGRGFAESSTVDITWTVGTYSLLLVNDYDTDSVGAFTTTFTVPAVTTGIDYIITAKDLDGGSATATFTMKGATAITLSPKSGLAGTTVKVTGEWFTAGKTVTVYFDATSVGTVTASSTTIYGFTDKVITIPVAATFGVHTIKAMDSEGVSATATFTVSERIIVIETRSITYMPGDTISFNIHSTVEFKKTGAIYDDIVIKIYDPDDYLFWSVKWKPEEDATTDTWIVPYSAQVAGTIHLTLPSDAKAGLWKWNATYYLTDVVNKIVKPGSFTVKAVTTSVIDEKITALEESINLLGVQILAAQTAAQAAQTAATTAGTKATAAETAAKAAQAAAEAAGTKATAAETAAKAALTAAQSAMTAAQAATTAAQASTTAANAAKASADAAKAATDSLTTLVYVAIGASAIAALAAVFAVMQISKKIA